MEGPVLLISCGVDDASMNIRQHVLGWGDWEEAGSLWDAPLLGHPSGFLLALLPDEHIFHETPDEEASAASISPSAIIFLSRHRSESGARSLTVHPLGNYGENRFGGRAGTLVPSAPRMMSAALRSLMSTGSDLDFNIAFEVTHHGPYLSTPTFFIEIGSGEEEWSNQDAGIAIASALREMASDPGDKVLVGVGGGHYAPRFSDIVCSYKASFGHMLPSYALEGLDLEEVVKRLRLAVDATPGVEGFYMHKKALKGETKRNVREAMDRIGLPLLSSKDLAAR